MNFNETFYSKMNKSRYEEVVDDDDEASEENTQELTFRIGSKIGLM
jgi:hypothetical protein